MAEKVGEKDGFRLVLKGKALSKEQFDLVSPTIVDGLNNQTKKKIVEEKCVQILKDAKLWED